LIATGVCPASQNQETKMMTMIIQLRDTLRVVREFIVPSYRPERHYMRGPGPACAQRNHGHGVQAS
jgi:hypothetical protein